MEQSRPAAIRYGLACTSLLFLVGCGDSRDADLNDGQRPEFSSSQKSTADEIAEQFPGVQVTAIATRGHGNGGGKPAAEPGVLLNIAAGAEITSDLKDLVRELNQERPIVAVLLGAQRMTDEDLEMLVDLPGVEKLTINDVQIGDAGMESVASLAGLQVLRIVKCPITDEGLARLASLNELETLWLASSEITGTGFADFSGHKNLRKVYLSGSPVTDEGLEYLAAIPGLETIVLDRTKITDKGMQHFTKLLRLELLNVESTKVTPQGVIDVQRVLTKVRILY